MYKFNLRDLEIIRNANIPISTLKRQISSMLQDSRNCNVKVENINHKTGEYRVVLQGKLEIYEKFQ